MSIEKKNYVAFSAPPDLEEQFKYLNSTIFGGISRSEMVRTLIEEGLHAAEEPRAAAPEEEQQ